VFSISGMAYRINPIEDSSRNATVSGGTCFSVASDGLILTAYHLIKDANNIKVRFEGAEELTAIPEQI
jgi:S1-C subfamily serine protease